MSYDFATIGTGTNNVNISFNDVALTGGVFRYFEVTTSTDLHLNRVLTRKLSGGSNANAALYLVNASGTYISNSDFTGCNTCTWLNPGSGQTVAWTFADNTVLGDSGSDHGLYLNPQMGGVIDGIRATTSGTTILDAGTGTHKYVPASPTGGNY